MRARGTRHIWRILITADIHVLTASYVIAGAAGTSLAVTTVTMTQTRPAPSNAVASQVAELASAAGVEAAHRRKAVAERAQQTAAVDAWLSRERAVLVAFIVAAPVLALVIY